MKPSKEKLHFHVNQGFRVSKVSNKLNITVSGNDEMKNAQIRGVTA
jgi:hypothetical protein